MKNTVKRISSLLLALMLVFSVTGTAFAADSSITFNGLSEGFGFQPGTQYTETDLFDNFKDVMPGDTLTQVINFTNLATDCDYIKLYMRAEAHDEEGNPLTYDEPFENEDGKDQANVDGQRDETVATMADFLAQLSMRVYNGEELIYEASPDELDGLAENVLLGEFRSGQTTTLTVELDVPITLGNEYANRVGEVDWVFTAEGFDDPEPEPEPDCDEWLTVHKIWKGPGPHPAFVRVNLLRDGQYYAHVYLTPLTQWTWTWGDLDDEYDWSVVEEVPDGYEADYYVFGNLTIITNTKIDPPPTEPDPTDPPPTEPEPTDPEPTDPKPTDPEPTDPEPTDPEPTDPEPTDPEPPEPAEPIDLTVKKEWSGDEEIIEDRPESVRVTLFNGSTAVETVVLGEWNDWQYTWKDLSSDGDWSVIEVNIPGGYTPSYRVSGNVVTITNNASLIQTGQLNWPIVVLSGLGVLMILVGGILILKKRDRNNV